MNDILDAMRDREVWIIGDLMLDEYIFGTVERVSPEAPVPVIRADPFIQYQLGGAANVARQVAALGAHARLAGVVGDDDAGRLLITKCNKAGIDTRAVIVDPDAARRTTRKIRVIARDQQLVRIDYDDARFCTKKITDDMCSRLIENNNTAHAIILSDYAKGVLTDNCIGQIVNNASISAYIVVDPKRRDLRAYAGADILTPNLAELSHAAGTRLEADDLATVAVIARRFVAGYSALVVTLGANGMLMIDRDGGAEHIPVMRRKAVSDVTGAGDTATAVLAVAVSAGATLREAVEIANAAASVAVTVVGTTAVEPSAIRAALNGGDGKIMPIYSAVAHVNTWRACGNKIVFTNGCFDLIHAGHLTLLHRAAALGENLVVAINSDASVHRLKGDGRPVVPANERAALIAALACVDAVIMYDEDSPLELIRAIRPDVLVKGDDYRDEKIIGREHVESYGGRVVCVPLVADVSTTARVERIRARK